MKTKKLSDEALEVLSRVTVDPAHGSRDLPRVVRLPDGQLDRSLYVEVNAALEAFGGKWTRGVKGHVFDHDPTGEIDNVVSAGCWVDVKKSLDQFYTPTALAERVVKHADVKGHVVLEPSAGSGQLAHECMAQGAKDVFCIEIDPSKVHAHLSSFPGAIVGDFLRCGAIEGQAFVGGGNFRRIVMNPPFSREQDAEHVLHAYDKFLAKRGILVAIMSAGMRFRQTAKAKAIRKLVEDGAGTMVDLPEKSFQESGTLVRSVLVTLVK